MPSPRTGGQSLVRSSTPAIEGGAPTRSDFLIFGRPLIGEAEIEEMVRTLRSGWIGTGPKSQQFEEQFRAYKNSRFAVAVNSCTAALHLSMLALGIGEGDEVITTPMTFCATANAIIHAGARPVFADCERDTMNIDPRAIERRITKRTKAIVPVHFAGRACDMEAIMTIAEKHRLRVIEDCAHAIETRYHGRPAGTFGDAGCFSFYVTKNVVTGEGGMIITQRPDIEQSLKVLALHGMSRDAWKRFSDEGYKHYSVIQAGFKYNFTDVQASLGIHQLKRIDESHRRRKQIWDRYQEAFAGLPCFQPTPEAPETQHAYHLYTLLLDTDRLRVGRDYFLHALTKENIGVGVHYLALNVHDFYKQFLHPGERFPEAEFISERTLSLPLSPAMSDEDVESVVHAVQKLLSYFAKAKS